MGKWSAASIPAAAEGVYTHTHTTSLHLELSSTSVCFQECVFPVARWQTYFNSDVTTSRRRGGRGGEAERGQQAGKHTDQQKRVTKSRAGSITLPADSILCHHFHQQTQERKSRVLWSRSNPPVPNQTQVGGKHMLTLGLTTSDHIKLEQGRPGPILKGPQPSRGFRLPGRNPGWTTGLDPRLWTVPTRKRLNSR